MTASKAIRGDASVRPHLRERVLQAARDLDYRPNLVARGLRSRSLDLVPISVIELGIPYFGKLAESLAQALTQDGLQPVLCDAPARLLELDQVLSPCGSIMAYAANAAVVQELAARQKVVTICAAARPQPNVANVSVDFAPVYLELIDAVLASARRRIGFFTPCWDDITPGRSWDKFGGVLAQLDAAGIEPVSPARGGAFTTAAEIGAFIDANPGALDTVFCEGDLMALKVYNLLQVRGLRVPDDILLIGCNDDLGLPGAWTVAVDHEAIAQAVVYHLRQLLGGASGFCETSVRPRPIMAGAPTTGIPSRLLED
jgi:LacI family transcriptional regulator